MGYKLEYNGVVFVVIWRVCTGPNQQSTAISAVTLDTDIMVSDQESTKQTSSGSNAIDTRSDTTSIAGG